MEKIITAFDVCTDKANGYWDRGVYYPGINDIGKQLKDIKK